MFYKQSFILRVNKNYDQKAEIVQKLLLLISESKNTICTKLLRKVLLNAIISTYTKNVSVMFSAGFCRIKVIIKPWKSLSYDLNLKSISRNKSQSKLNIYSEPPI